jgi:Flp pilus assembly protein TadD
VEERIRRTGDHPFLQRALDRLGQEFKANRAAAHLLSTAIEPGALGPAENNSASTMRTSYAVRAELRRIATTNEDRPEAHKTKRDLALLRAELESEPTNPDTWNALGVVLSSADRIADARDAFRKALALDPRHGEAQANLRSLPRTANGMATE